MEISSLHEQLLILSLLLEFPGSSCCGASSTAVSMLSLLNFVLASGTAKASLNFLENAEGWGGDEEDKQNSLNGTE